MATNNYALKYTGAEIDTLLAKVAANENGLKFIVVSELPVDNINPLAIYLMATESGDYNEWIYVEGAWEMLGTTAVDLTAYATKEYVEEQAMPKSDVINAFWKGTQAEYNSLTVKDDTTLYIIEE